MVLQSDLVWQQLEKLVPEQDWTDLAREYPCAQALLSSHHVGPAAQNYPWKSL
jgi:hypothetical protein